MIYHRLPFLAFAPVFPDPYLFDLGSPSQFPLSPIRQMNREAQSWHYLAKLKATVPKIAFN